MDFIIALSLVLFFIAGLSNNKQKSLIILSLAQIIYIMFLIQVNNYTAAISIGMVIASSILALLIDIKNSKFLKYLYFLIPSFILYNHFFILDVKNNYDILVLASVILGIIGRRLIFHKMIIFIIFANILEIIYGIMINHYFPVLLGSLLVSSFMINLYLNKRKSKI